MGKYTYVCRPEYYPVGYWYLDGSEGICLRGLERGPWCGWKYTVWYTKYRTVLYRTVPGLNLAGILYERGIPVLVRTAVLCTAPCKLISGTF